MSTHFLMLMGVRAVFTLAAQMQAIMLGFQMFALTHDPLHLGCVGLAEAVPALGLALWAGYIADRTQPLRLYTGVLTAALFSAAVFYLAQQPWCAASAGTQVALLYLASTATGVARAFSQPATYAAVPQLVPREQLARAAAWMSSSMQVARAAGPALGGVALAWGGAAGAGASVCALLLMALALHLSIPQRAVAPPPKVPRGSLAAELFEGARFVLAHPLLLPALSLDMLSVLFGGVTALLPIYARDILHVGPEALGMLRAAPAIGAAVGSLVLTRVALGRRAGQLLLWAVTGFGCCVLIFGASTHLVLSALALAASGAFDSISVVVRSAAVQLASPDALRGRISAVNAMFIGSSNELGEFESGIAAYLLGTVRAVLAGGALCLATVAVIATRAPALRRLDLTPGATPDRARA